MINAEDVGLMELGTHASSVIDALYDHYAETDHDGEAGEYSEETHMAVSKALECLARQINELVDERQQQQPKPGCSLTLGTGID